MGPGLFGDVINIILSGILTLAHGKLSRQSRFVGAPYTTAVFVWMDSHRSTPKGAAGHDDFSMSAAPNSLHTFENWYKTEQRQMITRRGRVLRGSRRCILRSSRRPLRARSDRCRAGGTPGSSNHVCRLRPPPPEK